MSGDFPTIAEAAALFAARKLSPVELTRACLDRIARLDGTLHSFLHLLPDQAMAAARAAEAAILRGESRGPLHGIPIGLKDIYETKGIPTTAHSRQLEHHVPAEDATCTRRLAEAGTVLLGKLATHEFAFGGPSFDLPWPPARNPWNPDHFTGGSSAAPAPRWRRGWCWAAWAPTPAGRSGCRPRSAASPASSPAMAS